MGYYITKRIAIGIVTIFALITITFFLTRWMPGNPFQNNQVSEQILEALEQEYGLNEPVFKQYTTYVSKLLQGDLGISYKKPGVTVNEVILRSMPATLTIGIMALVLATVLGIMFGIWQAQTKKKSIKSLLLIGTSLGVGIPNFVIAILLMLVFGVWLKWLPVSGLTKASNYILPVISLSMYPTAMIAKYTSTSFSATMQQEHILMARAKKLPWGMIVRKHILKNSMIPVINAMGPMIAFLLTGSFVVESIFTIPGLGREFVNSIANRDYTLIMGLVIFMGTIVIIVNITIDIICSWMDPRIRLAYKS